MYHLWDDMLTSLFAQWFLKSPKLKSFTQDWSLPDAVNVAWILFALLFAKHKLSNRGYPMFQIFLNLPLLGCNLFICLVLLTLPHGILDLFVHAICLDRGKNKRHSFRLRLFFSDDSFCTGLVLHVPYKNTQMFTGHALVCRVMCCLALYCYVIPRVIDSLTVHGHLGD